MKEKYGAGKSAEFVLKVSQVPSITLSNEKLESIVTLECILKIQIKDDTYEEFVKFSTNAKVTGNVSLVEQGILQAKVNEVSMVDVKIIEKKLEIPNLEWIDDAFNFASPIAVQILNEKYLSNTQLKLPTVEGI